MKISLIIPAYNEEKRISSTLKEYGSFFKKKFKGDFEIIIIPNNCSDNTLEVVEEFSKNKKQIKVYNIPYYVGKGGAVMKGFKLAKGDLIGFTDADNSTNPENFFKLYENILDANKINADGIIASRKIKGAIIDPPRNFGQNASSFIFNKIANLLFNLGFKDTQCGAKLFTKKTAEFLTRNYSEVGWGFDVDLLYLCKRKKLKIIEFPIKWKDAEGSKITLIAGIKTVAKLFTYRLFH